MHRSTLALLSPLLGLPLLAQSYPQDLIGVSFNGNTSTLDSWTSVGQFLGPTGFSGHNCMGRAGAKLYTAEQSGSGSATVRFLDEIDDVTGQATRRFGITRDLRALAERNSVSMFGVADAPLSDELVVVSVATGIITVIGPIGFGSVQGLTRFGNDLYGWDLTAGLVRIDAATGAGVDVNPAVGTNGANIQFLTTTAAGRVLGGNNSMYELNLATGVPTYRGAGAYSDLRGAEERFGVLYTFGQGCGTQLDLFGVPQAPTTIITRSTGSPSSGICLLFVGFDDRQYLSLPLPLQVDNLLGTVGCTAYAGPEISIAVLASPTGVATVPIAVPAGGAGLVFHVQHVSLTNAPGGLTFSNGGSVRVGL